jgi:hypothetical protein
MSKYDTKKVRIETPEEYIKRTHLDIKDMPPGYYPPGYSDQLMEYDEREVRNLRHRANYTAVDSANVNAVLWVLLGILALIIAIAISTS